MRWHSTASNGSSHGEHEAQSGYKIVEPVKDFEAVEATRPDFERKKPIIVTKSPNPDWRYGQGVLGQSDHPAAHHEVDPYASTRPMMSNYRLLISGIAPRPIGLISTVSSDAKSKNLSPFSYFQVVDHDPPTFIVGFSSRPGRVKDTYRNLVETGQCVINTVSEDMIEAVNATSMDPPYGVSEWEISGLTEAPTSTVKPKRVKESVLSIEAEVVEWKEFGEHRKEGMSVAGLVLLKATRFWVREDATNDELSHIDPDILRPVAQLGGMSYGRIAETFEVPRRRWKDEASQNVLLQKAEKGGGSGAGRTE